MYRQHPGHYPPPYYNSMPYNMPYQQPQKQGSDKWFYLTIVFAFAFILSQGWNFYQSSLKTEQKILMMQEKIANKRKKEKELKSNKGKDNLKLNLRKQLKDEDDSNIS